MDEIFLNSLMTYVPDLIAERAVLFKVRRGDHSDLVALNAHAFQ